MLQAIRNAREQVNALKTPYSVFTSTIGAFQANQAQLIVSSLIINVLSLALPILLLQVYDRIIANQSYSTLYLLIAGVGTALLLEAILQVARSYVTGWAAAVYEHKACCAMLDHLSHSEMMAFESIKPGAHLERMAAISKLRDFFGGQALITLIDLPFVVVFLVLITYLSGWLALVPVVILSLFTLCAFYASRRLSEALNQRIEAENSKVNFLMEVMTGIHTVKSMAMESSMLRRFEHIQEAATIADYNVATNNMAANSLGNIFSQLSLIAIVLVGSILVMDGHLTIGGLSACTLLIGRVMQPVQRALGTWTRFQDLYMAKKQVNEGFMVPQSARGDGVDMPEPMGELTLEGISYSFSAEEPLLQDISLTAQPQQTIAIRGVKGSGKTTLFSLIMGTLTPDKGTVLIDGVPVNNYNAQSMRDHIGYMPQKGVLFRGTIMENLTCFHKDKATLEHAREVAQELGIDKVISALPRGYDTYLSDGPADAVSPGVKQRITLARVLINQPKILLFDDADRALDKEGYNLIFKTLGRLKGKCTLLLITQDENLRSFADTFYVLENGKLLKDTHIPTNNLALFNKQFMDI